MVGLRRVGSGVRFADLFQAFGSRGSEVGGVLDRSLEALREMITGLPTQHGETHLPDGSDPIEFPGVAFQKSGVFVAPLVAADAVVWRAPYAATVTAVRGYRVGGTGATINARRNGTDEHLSSDLSLTSAGTWMDGGAVQNTEYEEGDSMELRLKSVAGAPSAVAVQVELTTRP